MIDRSNSANTSSGNGVRVFIRDRLVIHLRAIRGAQNASMNLNTLGLTAGNTHSFDLFVAERHTTTNSNLRRRSN
jgi:fibro-slime domain-containing protein